MSRSFRWPPNTRAVSIHHYRRIGRLCLPDLICELRLQSYLTAPAGISVHKVPTLKSPPRWADDIRTMPKRSLPISKNPPHPRKGTQQAKTLAALRSRKRASTENLAATTGLAVWQVRGAIGRLRMKGWPIEPVEPNKRGKVFYLDRSKLDPAA